ncbi:MAG: hypothetical protein CMP05_12375 [Xanthomarina sp.]|nr:hypothetical protein [Xanthomarina sp.]MAL22921.1 hypothetical protein [Xanthomarina sp.]MBF62775.1 hypothetical protein [Xanthomarina sp.]HAB28096.1 hypothetical protein [Xanthomarina gelatinilytica]HAI17281.1 hypothetical protein [Xanthomarina gelatinilytica]|tara:strand:+ start:1198 stop:1437 length:240 start_codon:yes stop_codon:yes gene_type:complete
MVKLYIIGISILLVAIIANAVAIKIGLKSWYVFIQLLSDIGLSAFRELNLWDYFWMFLGYPLTLGLGYLLGAKLYAIFF